MKKNSVTKWLKMEVLKRTSNEKMQKNIQKILNEKYKNILLKTPFVNLCCEISLEVELYEHKVQRFLLGRCWHNLKINEENCYMAKIAKMALICCWINSRLVKISQ